MALKFPSQNKLQYVSGGAISNDGWTTFGFLNLPKDLSIVNRRGYASTDSKGVPLVYRCRVTSYPQDEDGFGLNAAVGSDFATTLKIDGCQNNWVMRNAAVKFHAAREKMFRDSGVLKRHRGAYAHEIRYAYDNASQTWLNPIDGDGDAFAGGTWDLSGLTTEDDYLMLKLVGLGTNEESAISSTALQIGFSYLSSRGQVPTDSNLEASAGPTDHSFLNSILHDVEDYAVADDVKNTARGEADNPPYDEWAAADTDHDITEAVELGRCVTGVANGVGSVIVDIPFGLANLRATHYDAADTNITSDISACIEVLDIYPMQG